MLEIEEVRTGGSRTGRLRIVRWVVWVIDWTVAGSDLVIEICWVARVAIEG